MASLMPCPCHCHTPISTPASPLVEAPQEQPDSSLCHHHLALAQPRVSPIPTLDSSIFYTTCCTRPGRGALRCEQNVRTQSRAHPAAWGASRGSGPSAAPGVMAWKLTPGPEHQKSPGSSRRLARRPPPGSDAAEAPCDPGRRSRGPTRRCPAPGICSTAIPQHRSHKVFLVPF